MSASDLTKPRYLQATATPPGDPAFWRAMLDQSDNFAFLTAQAGQGGPFGAQLWLVNAARDEYVLVGTPQHREAANAVLVKGIASAHAEAENLSPENCRKVRSFLDARRGEGWQIVQISSGESCPSCRARQVHFAYELIHAGLIAPGDFTVVFKASYEQTAEVAGFGDAPYDQAFRAIDADGLIDSHDFLIGLHASVRRHAGAAVADRIVPVQRIEAKQDVALPQDRPFAFLRLAERDLVEIGEGRPIERVLYRAAQAQGAAGSEAPWDLGGTRLLTNIHDIGPIAYAESFWFNIGGIDIVEHGNQSAIDAAALECPPLSNRDFFRAVAAPYNSPDTPLRTAWLGDPDRPSIAHLYWRATLEREALLKQQARRLRELTGHRTRYVDGGAITLGDVIEAYERSSHYDRSTPD